METYEIALIGIGGTVIGVLLGAWVTYRFSLRLADINTRKEANRRLIYTFHTELSDVYPNPVNWPKDIDSYLKSKFTTLQSAVGEFRYYLSTKERQSFDDAWFSYYCSTEREEIDRSCQNYTQYMNIVSTTNGQTPIQQDGQMNLKKKIDQILKFANKI